MTESQAAGIVAHMPEFDLTILYDKGEDGWIVASIPAVPGALSQGRTRAEARENVLDALALMLSPEPIEANDERERELLHLSYRVKRRKLEQHLRQHGCHRLDQGGNHTRWIGPGGARSAVPRHREIDHRLARSICRQLEVPAPTGSR